MHIHRFSFSHEKPQVRYWNDGLLSQSPGYGCPHWYLYRHRITCKDTVERWTLMNGTMTIYETSSQKLRKVQCLQILAKGLILYYYWFSSRNISTLLLGGSLTIQILRGALDEDGKMVSLVYYFIHQQSYFLMWVLFDPSRRWCCLETGSIIFDQIVDFQGPQARHKSLASKPSYQPILRVRRHLITVIKPCSMIVILTLWGLKYTD